MVHPELPQLPLSIQTFEKLRLGHNFLYVDKTGILYELLRPDYGVYFLSRPRRFGKSLTITTLESIFKGKKELFNGLEIAHSEYDWPIHPVIRLDMKMATHTTLDRTIQSLNTLFKDISAQYGVTINDIVVEDQFYRLIQTLHHKTGQKVVILIDEYDKPLINQLEFHQSEKAIEIQKFLKSFYGVLKTADEHIRFVFITGVSKFTKVSIFSDLNHLVDISMSAQFASICGYTQNELETHFSSWIDHLAHHDGLSRNELLTKIQEWYNGYRLTEANVTVYNPWSTLHLFKELTFKQYWFDTGTPTFLTKLMKSRPFDLDILQHSLSDTDFSSYDIESLQLIPLMFQTGYLTIKEFEPKWRQFRLDFPNKEVAQAFSKLLVSELTEEPGAKVSQVQIALLTALETDNITEFFNVINVLFAAIPSHLHQKAEAYYHSIFIAACQMAGVPIEAEQSSSLGRSDAVLQSLTTLYIIEFKLNGTAQDALDQIYQKRYMDKYRYLGIPIVPVGVAFDYSHRMITDVQIG